MASEEKNIEYLFEKMEIDLELFNRNVNGIYYWSHIRFWTYNLIKEKSGVFSQPHDAFPQNKFKKFLSSFVNIIFYNPFAQRKVDVLFIGHSRRKLEKDGKWWDIYTDVLSNTLTVPNLTYEEYYQNSHFKPAKTKRLCYGDFISAIAFILKKIRKIPIVERELKEFLDIDEYIKENFKLNINIGNSVKEYLATRNSKLKLYELFLRKIKPKIIFAVVGYCNDIILEAAMNLNIKTCELQHGIISKQNYAYSFKPYLNNVFFPDYFFTFGDYWANSADFPIEKQNVFSLGFPYLEIKKERYVDIVKEETILLISQGTIGKQLSKFAIKLRAHFDKSINIIYKLHPGEYLRWQSNYPWLKDSGISVIDNNKDDLYKLFALSKIQIGVYSMALFEGMCFGCKTYLLNVEGVEHLSSLIETGNVKVISYPEEVCFDMEDMLVNKQDLFAKNWKERFLSKVNILTNQDC